MTAEVVDRFFRRFIVRVDSRDGAMVRGTGVLVAPGWVLTCAHVVADVDEVLVVPDRDAGGGERGDVPARVDGLVRARSGPRDPASGSVFWPFPDLALVELPAWSSHVVAPLVLLEPSRQGELHAWGFGRREDGVLPPGSPASFRYVGEDGDGYFQLKAGDAPPGLSGAPLVCPVRGGVVALMSVARDVDDARGGWASPIAALSADGRLMEDVAALAVRVVELNRFVAWRHRNVWARVIAFDGAGDMLDRSWDGASFDRASGVEIAPSLMLRAEFRVVDYRFRDDDLSSAVSWCDRQARFSISHVDAAGGAGKTRFAIELCRAMAERGWVAGFLPRSGRGIDAVKAPRLIVVDYVEERDATRLSEQLAELDRSATAMAPVRVLMLARPAANKLAGRNLDALREQSTGSVLASLEQAEDRTAVVTGLGLPQRLTLYGEGLVAFGRAWHGPDWIAPTDKVDLASDRYASPFDVLLEAYDTTLSTSSTTASARPPVDRALDHEMRHWQARHPGLDQELLRRAVALATLAGARNEQESGSLLDLVFDPGKAQDPTVREQLNASVSGLYHGPDRWNPLRPDRLGEVLVLRALMDLREAAREWLNQVLTVDSDTQLEQALDTLGRIAVSGEATEAMIAAFIDQHRRLVDRCQRQARGTPQQPGHTDLLTTLVRLHVALLTDQRVEQQPLDRQARISASADRLGDLARDHGRGNDALTIFTRALAIDERKHQLEPGNTAYQRDLSISYERLGDLAERSSDLAIARSFIDRATQLRRRVQRIEPGWVEVAIELAYALYMSARLAVAAGSSDAGTAERQEILTVLSPLETSGALTERGHQLLRFAREVG